MPRSRLFFPASLLSLLLGACAQPQKPAGALLFPAATADNDALLLADGSQILHLKERYRANVGDTFDLSQEREIQITITIDNQKPGSPHTTATPDTESQTQHTLAAGRLQVTAIDALQHPSAFSFTVNKLQGPKAEDLLPPNSVIDIANTPQGESFSLRNGKLSSDAQLAIRGLLLGSLSSDLEIDPQKPLAPPQIGDAWPNAEVPPVTPSKPGAPTVEFTDLHGQTTLHAIETVHDLRALRLNGDSTGKFKIKGLPFGFSADSSDMKTTQSLLIPLDSTLPILEQTISLDMHITLSGSILFVPVKMKMATVVHQTQTLIPVQKGPPLPTTRPL